MMRRGLTIGLTIVALTTPTAGTALAQATLPEVQGRGICFTQLGWCPLADPARTPLGVACYCIMPGNRIIYGVTSSYLYYGQVNPFFNPHPAPIPSTIK